MFYVTEKSAEVMKGSSKQVVVVHTDEMCKSLREQPVMLGEEVKQPRHVWRLCCICSKHA